MELCLSSLSLNFPLHFKPSSSSFLSINISNSSLSNKHNLTIFNKTLFLSSPSLHHSSLLPTSSSSYSPAFASASSTSSTADVKEDRLPAPLDVTEFKEPNSRVRLSVHVPELVCDDCYHKVLKELMKQVKIPGFRPGKVPEGILLKYAGEKNVERATIESILTRTLPHAMSSVDGRALKDSVRISTNFSDMEEMYSSSNSLRFDILVDVMPEVKWNPVDGYKNLKMVVEIDNEVTAEVACERELKRRHKTLGPLRIVVDRGLQVGDVAVLDISAATIEQDGDNTKTIPSNESKGFNFDTEEGDIVVPGFLDSIIGIRPGETKSFPLMFPESWKQEELQGVNALFTVDCKELFYRDLPVLDDSLADKLIPGCSTLAEVKEALLQKCQQLEQTVKDQATDNAILDQLRKMVEVEIPQSLLEEEGRQMYGARLLEIQARMKLNDEQLASLTRSKTVNEYIEQEKENIVEIIKQNLAVGDIFKRENLEVSTEDIVKEVKNSIDEFKRHKQEYDEDRIKEQVQEVLEGAKVLEWLRERAEIQYVTK